MNTPERLKKFDPLFQQRIGTIKQFATRKLAEQLGGVECQEPRQETDWFTAENFLNGRLTGDQWIYLVKRDLILRAYDCLREKRILPGISQAVIHCFAEGSSDFMSITETLFALPEEHLSELLTEASKSDDNMDSYLGRTIWNWGYQQIKSVLPRPPYGKINFH